MATILIVDDSAFARQRLGRVLKARGHQVMEAESGSAALKVLQEFQPDLITVDLLMPEMDGLELIQKIKRLFPALLIAAVSADVQKASQEEALSAGASIFFSKTGDPEDLLEFVRRIEEKSPPAVITPLQQDAFTEIINIAMGQAASGLSTMLQKPVQLTVPRLRMMGVSALDSFLDQEISSVGAVVLQRFSGVVTGTGCMVLPQEHALTLVRVLIGTQKELRQLSSAEQTVLAEVGNIVLNSALAVLGDRIGSRLTISLPMVFLTLTSRSLTEMMLNETVDSEQAVVLLSRLSIGSFDLLCYLIFMLPQKDIDLILDKLGVA
jgi:chemotaxis protein CheC